MYSGRRTVYFNNEVLIRPVLLLLLTPDIPGEGQPRRTQHRGPVPNGQRHAEARII